MNLLLHAHTPTNEHLECEYLQFRASFDGLARLIALRQAAQDFLQAAGITVGHVAFALPPGCELTAHDWDEATEQRLGDAECVALNPGEIISAPPTRFRTDLHQLVVYPGGGDWLRCHPRDSADLIEAAFTPPPEG